MVFDFGMGIDCGGGNILGNFSGDELVFVVEFWWKVVVWVYWREREREREN